MAGGRRGVSTPKAAWAMSLLLGLLLAAHSGHCTSQESESQSLLTRPSMPARKFGAVRALLQGGPQTPPTPRVLEVPDGATPAARTPLGKSPAPAAKSPPAKSPVPAAKSPPAKSPAPAAKSPPAKSPAPGAKSPPAVKSKKSPSASPKPRRSPPPPPKPRRSPPPPPPVLLGLQPRGTSTPYQVPPGTPVSPPPAAYTVPPSEVTQIVDGLYPGDPSDSSPSPGYSTDDPNGLLSTLFGIPLPRPPPWSPGAPAPPPSPPPPPKPIPDILITPTPSGPSLPVDIINQLFGGVDDSVSGTAQAAPAGGSDDPEILDTLFPGEDVVESPPPPATVILPVVPAVSFAPPPLSIGTVSCGLLLVEGQQCGGLSEAPATITPVDDKWPGICCSAGLRCVRVSSMDWRCRVDT